VSAGCALLQAPCALLALAAPRSTTLAVSRRSTHKNLHLHPGAAKCHSCVDTTLPTCPIEGRECITQLTCSSLWQRGVSGDLHGAPQQIAQAPAVEAAQISRVCKLECRKPPGR